MTDVMICPQCREDICGEPVLWKGKAYCCDACAFEASKRRGSICGSGETTEVSQRFASKGPTKG